MYNFFAKLQNFLEASTDHSTSDHTIAEYILRHVSEIPDMSIYELAEACHLSPATVSRFCRRFENISFKELKEHASEFNDFNLTEIFQRPETDSIAGIPNYFQQVKESLADTENLLQVYVLQQAAILMQEANKLSFFGVTFSNVVAKNAQIKFMRLGKHTASYSNHENQITEANTMIPDDLAIVISSSGDTRFIIKLTKELSRNEVPILAITSNPNSYLGQHAKIIIQVSGQKMEGYKSPILEEINLQAAVNMLYLHYSGRYN
ncbi:MurR/RpiR family transcriptional regulator [Terribacillus sp. JSM ZJ617]|uniref:MurR/RpiR family transcriptional regulator n=1 Tax=Terribacillus sp. JSM ZJ617 TaxID=3342119 RepID=UPI0035A973BF